MEHGGGPHDDAPPVVPDDRGLFEVEGVEEPDQVGDEHREPVALRLGRFVRVAVPALVVGDRPEAGSGQGGELMSPRVGEFGEPVDEDDRRTVPDVGDAEGEVPVDGGDGASLEFHGPRLPGDGRRHIVGFPTVFVAREGMSDRRRTFPDRWHG